MKATELLSKQHRKVEELFAEYKAFGTSSAAIYSKRAVVDDILKDLNLHMHLEEEIFYPAARQVLQDHEVDHAEDEHSEAKVVMSKLETSSQENIDQLVAQLEKSIKHHVQEEEGKMFPKLEKSKLDLENIAKQLDNEAKKFAP